MSEPNKPKPPADPPKSTPQPMAADSAKLSAADVPEGSDTARAFISYASADSSIADAVCRALEREGVKCWIAPRDVTPGELYAGNIVHAIDTTRVVVLVLSQHAADSGHVLREVERASSKRHPIVSFRIDLTPLPDDFAYFLNTSQWLDASATGVDRALPRLVEAVKSALGKPMVARVAHPPVKAKASRRPSHIILALAVIVAGVLTYFAADRFWLSKRDDSQKALVEATPAKPADSSGPLPTPAKSIAVLPFVNMSSDKDQEYFADGIAEELLNLLAQVPDLKVIARTSSFAFKGEKIEIAEIANKLNVAYVVEGSVRKSGDKLRITAQLVRTADSVHLWSETYDRPLDDIFEVQDEIAGAIVQALQIRLMGGKLTRREGGTQNLEAYQLYLLAASIPPNTKSSIDAVEDYLAKAVKLDPSYGLAWAALGNLVGIKTEGGFLASAEGWERARQLTQHALQLSPELPEAHAYLGYIHLYFDWDWTAARGEVQRALAIDPTSPGALFLAGMLSRTLGQWDKAEREFRAALVRSPLDSSTVFGLGFNYYLAGRFDESERVYRELLELENDFVWARAYLSKTLLALGKHDAALAMLRDEVDEGMRLLYLPIILQAVGRQGEADMALQAQIERWGDTGAYAVALTYAYRGENDRALDWLERAYRQKDVGLAEIVGEPLLNSLADDPRYKAFLRKMNLPE